MPDLGNFDSSKYGDMRTFGIVPEGDYPMQIVKSERKKASTGGEYLNLHVEVIAGEHKGSMVFPKLNLWHASENTVLRANEELATICRAVGAPTNPRSSEVLHRIPFIGSVEVNPPTEKYPKESNSIVKYAPYDATKVQQSAGSAASPPVKGKDIPPWAKKKEKSAEQETAFDSPQPSGGAGEDDIPL